MATKRPDSCSFRDDELVINYHDVVIYGSDLSLFEQRSAWLNDTCINFFFTWLQQRRRQDDAVSTSECDTVFLDPAVVSFVMHQCSDVDDVDDLLHGNNNFKGVQRIFIPINDMLNSSQWTRPGGGSHWSLLFITLPKLQVTDVESVASHVASYGMWHFDSIRGNNIGAARDVAAKFQQILDHAALKQGTTIPSNGAEVTVLECKTPQQANGYDCGVHMLATAEYLSEIPITENLTREQCEHILKNRMTSQTCPEMRSRIAREIITIHGTLRKQSACH